jgi:hypothetical protein
MDMEEEDFDMEEEGVENDDDEDDDDDAELDDDDDDDNVENDDDDNVDDDEDDDDDAELEDMEYTATRDNCLLQALSDLFDGGEQNTGEIQKSNDLPEHFSYDGGFTPPPQEFVARSQIIPQTADAHHKIFSTLEILDTSCDSDLNFIVRKAKCADLGRCLIYDGEKTTTRQFLGLFVGELIPFKPNSRTACNLSNGWMLDPKNSGNLFGFMNFSHKPNVEFIVVTVAQKSGFVWGLRTITALHAGDEMTVDYKHDLDLECPCYCGEKVCQLFLGHSTSLDPKTVTHSSWLTRLRAAPTRLELTAIAEPDILKEPLPPLSTVLRLVKEVTVCEHLSLVASGGNQTNSRLQSKETLHAGDVYLLDHEKLSLHDELKKISGGFLLGMFRGSIMRKYRGQVFVFSLIFPTVPVPEDNNTRYPTPVNHYSHIFLVVPVFTSHHSTLNSLFLHQVHLSPAKETAVPSYLLHQRYVCSEAANCPMSPEYFFVLRATLPTREQILTITTQNHSSQEFFLNDSISVCTNPPPQKVHKAPSQPKRSSAAPKDSTATKRGKKNKTDAPAAPMTLKLRLKTSVSVPSPQPPSLPASSAPSSAPSSPPSPPIEREKDYSKSLLKLLHFSQDREIRLQVYCESLAKERDTCLEVLKSSITESKKLLKELEKVNKEKIKAGERVKEDQRKGEKKRDEEDKWEKEKKILEESVTSLKKEVQMEKDKVESEKDNVKNLKQQVEQLQKEKKESHEKVRGRQETPAEGKLKADLLELQLQIQTMKNKKNLNAGKIQQVLDGWDE